MLSSSGLTGLSGRSGGLLYRGPPPPAHAARLGLYEDDEDEDDDDSTDEYGSCTEAPLYENVHDDEDEDDERGGVYENVVFEPPAYSNLLLHRQDDVEDEDDDDGQVYANVPAVEEAPTYDVPQRLVHKDSHHQPQEYANLPTSATAANTPATAGGA